MTDPAAESARCSAGVVSPLAGASPEPDPLPPGAPPLPPPGAPGALPPIPEPAAPQRRLRGVLAWAQQTDLAGLLTQRIFTIFGWIVVVVGAAMPARGIGGTLCLFYLVTKCPCPACGLTRSVTALYHGHVYLSLQYHPLGWIIAVLAPLFASRVFWPKSWRERERAWLRHRSLAISYAALLLLLAWVGYGFARAALTALGWFPFPPE